MPVVVWPAVMRIRAMVVAPIWQIAVGAVVPVMTESVEPMVGEPVVAEEPAIVMPEGPAVVMAERLAAAVIDQLNVGTHVAAEYGRPAIAGPAPAAILGQGDVRQPKPGPRHCDKNQ